MSSSSPATELTPASRMLLLKLCGLLGSDQDGERAAAARKASELLLRQGLSWDQVVAYNVVASASDPAAAAPPAAARKPIRRGPLDWRADLVLCRRYRHWLTFSEGCWIDRLPARPESLAPEHTPELSRIARRLRRQLSWAR